MAETNPTSPSAGQPVVAVQRLTKVFKDFWLRDRARAVDEVTFQINRGEIFGLLGPNGSGKSTTIKMMLGLLRPTSGRIAVFGKPPTDVRTKKRIGYLPEESYLYGFLNSRETLDYYGKLFQIDPRTRKKRIDELLEMVGLQYAATRPVRDYSKGMQRRIGIAQALINDPDFLILDEPTTGLDPIGTRQVKDLIIELGRRGKTVLLSSHLLADVEDCVDRMVILYGGKIRREGTCDQLLTTAGRTTIETEHLDDDTIAEIDRIIRARTQGDHAIRRVSKPRQKLEELFLDIVNQAQTERLATSGAVHGGATAAFLRAEDEGETGDAVIDRLVSSGDAPADLAPAQVEGDKPAAKADEGEDQSAIDALLAGDESSQPAASHADRPAPTPQPDAAPAPKPAEDVDESVIDSLLDASDGDADKDRGR